MLPSKSLSGALVIVLGTTTLLPTALLRACAQEKRATRKECLQCRSHKGIVWSVAWSPGGKLVVSGDELQVIAWDPDTGREAWRLSVRHPVAAMAFSPDGKTLAAVTWDGMIYFSEAATGKWLRSLRGSKDRLLTVAWSPDGTLLACGGDDGYISLRDVISGKEIRRLQGASAQPAASCGTFSPDGRLLATARDAETTSLFEVATGKESRCLVGQTCWATDVAFSPDGNLLATAHTDSAIRLWNVRTGKERRKLAGHTNTAGAVAFSRDGWLLASGGPGSLRSSVGNGDRS